MNQQVESSDAQQEGEQELPQIETLFTGECPSISGRSTLTYAIGRHPETSRLHIRIVSNTGSGMFSDEWADEAAVDVIVQGATELTAKSFHPLHPGRSINTGGFVMAVLKALGYIRPNAENTRLHEQVPTETFAKVAMACIASSTGVPEGPKPGRRKPKGG
jgi:hypothetical protein